MINVPTIRVPWFRDLCISVIGIHVIHNAGFSCSVINVPGSHHLLIRVPVSHVPSINLPPFLALRIVYRPIKGNRSNFIHVFQIDDAADDYVVLHTVLEATEDDDDEANERQRKQKERIATAAQAAY